MSEEVSFSDSSDVEKFKVPAPGTRGCLTMGVETFGLSEVDGSADPGFSVEDSRARLVTGVLDSDRS